MVFELFISARIEGIKATSGPGEVQLIRPFTFYLSEEMALPANAWIASRAFRSARFSSGACGSPLSDPHTLSGAHPEPEQLRQALLTERRQLRRLAQI